MKDYLEPIIDKTESVMDKIMHRTEQGIDAFMHGPKFLTRTVSRLIENTFDRVYDLASKDTKLGRLLRYISLPWSILIPKGYKYFFSNNNIELIFVQGVHMVRAKVGGGKSLLTFVLAEMFLEQTGLGSYFTSPVEKPQVTEDGKWLFVHHRVINTDDYYDGTNKKKTKNFNTDKYKVMFKDERHLDYNPRLWASTGYRDKFILEQKDEILMRHEGMTHIYKCSQYTKLDSQDMQALTYMHDVETIKDIPLQKWLDTGRFDIIPVRLKVTTYIVDVSFDGTMKRKKVGSCKLRVSDDVLSRFDTYAERYRNAGLPVDYK